MDLLASFQAITLTWHLLRKLNSIFFIRQASILIVFVWYHTGVHFMYLTIIPAETYARATCKMAAVKVLVIDFWFQSYFMVKSYGLLASLLQLVHLL